jgi:hypothetical protein
VKGIVVYLVFGYDHRKVELSAYCGVGSEALDFFSKLLRLWRSMEWTLYIEHTWMII